MDNHQHIRCWNVCLSAWRGGREEGWGVAKKKRGKERGEKRVAGCDSNWQWLMRFGSASPCTLLPAFNSCTNRALNPVLHSFSPGTGLRQQSHTLLLTSSLTVCLTPSTFPWPHLSISSPLDVWNLPHSWSQPRPPKQDQQSGRLYLKPKHLDLGAHCSTCYRGMRRFEKGLTDVSTKDFEHSWENLLEFTCKGNASFWNLSPIAEFIMSRTE